LNGECDTINNKRANNAVSEIIGTMLLLLIAISALSVIYFQVLSDDGPTPNTIVKIVGREEGKFIILEHQGGETIGYDTKITYTIAGYTDSSTIGKLAEVDKEPLDVWNLGERLKIPIRYNLDLLDEFQTAEITGIDIASNSIVFSGPVDLPQPTSDVGVGITIYYVNGTPVKAGDHLLINITITSYGGDVNGSGGVTVYYKMPEGLDYTDSFSPSGHNDGPYDPETYNWNWTAGNILVGSPAKLQINAAINGTMGRRPTQLAMVLDGSGSIEDYDWDLMRTGLANSIRNESVFPQDGSVELTVVQFGNSYAVVEVPPTNVTNGTIANNTADYVLNITQRYSNTPMAAGIYLATDQLLTSQNFSSGDRQAIIVVTDGVPNRCSARPFGNRPNGPYYSPYSSSCDAEESAVTSRNDLRSKFNMTNEDDTIDEIDSLAVGVGGMYGAPDVDWLNSSIVWPNPYIWDITSTDSYSDPGWVATIDSFEQFESAIKEMFIALFSIQNTVNFVSSTTYDPNDDNNYATVTIQG